MSYLKKLPFDYLKIDRTFVRDIETSTDDRAITNAIITLAHALEMKVIAEGVETRSQLNLLEELQCDTYQGYHCSKPLLPGDVEQMLIKRNR